LSSTTDFRQDRGQVLVIFALALTVLFLFAALAFDTGMVLTERRDEANAADAAALAGARYLPDDPTAAIAAARLIATANGYTNGSGSQTVVVNVPPTSGPNAGSIYHIEVNIGDNRPSIFAGVAGVAGWNVAARAVAANQNGVGGPFALLALEPTDCDALLVTGNGAVVANGNIQVNSTCSTGALHRGGGGTVTVTATGAACNAVGGIQDPGNKMACVKNEGAPLIPDPLSTLGEPAVPAFPTAALQVGGTPTAIPGGCPGGATAATAAVPAVCQFPSSYAGTTWRLYPGYYPGGIKIQGGSFYLEPGIYYIGGGGFTAVGNGTVTTSVGTGGTTLNYGVMFFNTEDSVFSSQCASGTASDPTIQCIQPIDLAGATASVNLYPLNNGSVYDGLVIYEDRDIEVGNDLDFDVILNGSTSTTVVRGTIYVPSGEVQANGSGGNITVDQVIADRFVVNGSTGSSIGILFDANFVFGLTAAGLVE
jgi:hypothetical protein